MSGYTQTDAGGPLRRLLRRPDSLVESTRWLFMILLVTSMITTLPAPLMVIGKSKTPALAATLIAVAIVTLTVSWTRGYLRRTATLNDDIVDALATAAFAVCCPNPVVVISFACNALWFRAFYGTSPRRAIIRFCLYSLAILAVIPVWPALWRSAAPQALQLAVAALPILGVLTVGSYALGDGLLARERSDRRSAALGELAADLLGVTDAARIRAIAVKTLEAFCAATPGLHVLHVAPRDRQLHVLLAIGAFSNTPEMVVADIMPAAASPFEVEPHAAVALNAAVGGTFRWLCVALPTSGTWLLCAYPRRLPADVVVAIGSLVNTVVLAMRNSVLHARLAAQASTDSLTKLVNRASFETAAQLALADPQTRQTTLLFIDLDNFKRVNDVLGHAAGDDVLRRTAAILREYTRSEDTCARLGGDEFAVLCVDTSIEEARAIARRIVNAIGHDIGFDDPNIRIGASIGVAGTTTDIGLDALMERADGAMYAAKSSGKNRVEVALV